MPESVPPFAGLLVENRNVMTSQPLPVRHETARPGHEIVTLRYFKIKKGTFPQFHKESVEGVWPYAAKIGVRVVGQWQVIHPEISGTAVGLDAPDYDEVYMMTHYASIDHWAATRDMAKLGGNGPDWDRCAQALQLRDSVTLETWVLFLEGAFPSNGPYFMPSLNEQYALRREEA